MKPNTLCRLTKEKLIDTFPGFVDTFNYVCDFISNLRGDVDGSRQPSDSDGEEKLGVYLDRADPEHPIIKIVGDSSGGCDIKLVGTDGSNAIIGNPASTKYKTLTFASETDANVTVKVTGDGSGNATVKIGVYYTGITP